MTGKTLIGVIDQGTSSSRFVIFSSMTGEIVAMHQIEIERESPYAGWVQQSANDIYESTLKCINEAAAQLKAKNIQYKEVASIGITNQRETTIAWDSKTGEPLCPAIVWLDSRTSEIVDKYIDLAPGKDKNVFQKKTGLLINSYFSATKIRWMLDNLPAVKQAEEEGRLKVGTVDSWLIYKLTGGAVSGKHLTDVTNASRTLLFNIVDGHFDPEICKFFGIKREILPKVISSAEHYGYIKDPTCRLKGVALGGILGDQQAALVGQTWDTNPDPNTPRPHIKITYGTGAFLLWNVGEKPVFSDKGLLTTVAFKMGKNATTFYALEGSIANAGSTVDWLRKKLELYDAHSEGEELALNALKKTHGDPNKQPTIDSCFLVPAFTGLSCPYWREDAKAVIANFSESCTRGDVIAAGIRASAYQTEEVIRAGIQSDKSLSPPRVISVDGGLSNYLTLMYGLADLTGATICRPRNSNLMTALGAAVATAISLGIDPSKLLTLREHEPNEQEANIFRPRIDEETKKLWISGWQSAVKRSLGQQLDE